MNPENNKRVVVVVGLQGERQMTVSQMIEKLARGEISVVEQQIKTEVTRTPEEMISEVYGGINLRETKEIRKDRHPALKGLKRQWWLK